MGMRRVLYRIKKSDIRGFSLVEAMGVVMIMIIVLAGVFAVLGAGRNTWFSGAAYVDIHQELRKVRDSMNSHIENTEVLNF